MYIQEVSFLIWTETALDSKGESSPVKTWPLTETYLRSLKCFTYVLPPAQKSRYFKNYSWALEL